MLFLSTGINFNYKYEYFSFYCSLYFWTNEALETEQMQVGGRRGILTNKAEITCARNLNKTPFLHQQKREPTHAAL